MPAADVPPGHPVDRQVLGLRVFPREEVALAVEVVVPDSFWDREESLDSYRVGICIGRPRKYSYFS